MAQPLALTLRLRGETVIGVEPPESGYSHRGIIDLVKGKTPDEALPIIERTCSLAHETHRIAFCQAVEAATGTKINKTAETTRVLFAEVERLLARLWTLALAARAANTTQLYRLALDQRESLFATLEASAGVRHFWAIALPGGVRHDLDLASLQDTLNVLAPGLTSWKNVAAPNGPLGRAGNRIGMISTEQAQMIGLTGLAGRGSGLVHDLRVTKPYAAYADYQAELADEEAEPVNKLAGDVMSRLSCAAADLVTSHAIALAALSWLLTEDPSETAAALVPPAGNSSAMSSVEGPHGPITLSCSYTNENVLGEFELETPGATLVQALPLLLEGRLLPQVPFILASLDLCIECIDQ